jgi:MFS family permease/pSer/pThr/pTyr-binding forkhead associated (FHA) protein
LRRCPLCNKESPDERKFCPHDGTPLVDVIPPPAPPSARIPAAEAPGDEATAKLSIRLPDGSISEIPLSASELGIGRAPDNAILISDPTVSRYHATLRSRDGQYFIVDAGSASGIFVNGQRVGSQGQPLRHGDVVTIGRTILTLGALDTAKSVDRRAPAVETVRREPPAVEPPPQRPSRPSEQHFPEAPPPDVPRQADRRPPPAESLLGRMAGAEQGKGRKIVLDGRYELETKLAVRTNGTLYRARRIMLGDQVAVRVLRPELVNDRSAYDRFCRQAQVAARIHHPNSVQVYDFGSTPEGVVYTVEELVSGRTLRDVLNEQRGLTLSRIVGIMNQICGAAHAAHLNGIVLRDIKPESIYVEEGADGKEIIKVGGYDLAKVDASLNSGVTMAEQAMVFGSPEYMSPEQFLDQPLDSRSDVYSLGVLLFEMLTGTVPFDALRAEQIAQLHLTAPVPDITEIGRPDLDEGVAAVVNRALAKDPNARQPTALQLAEELEAVSGAGGGIVGTLINRATRVRPIPQMSAPAQSVAGEAYLPSVVAAGESKGAGTMNPVVLALMAEAFLSRVSGGLVKTALPLYALLVFGMKISSVMALVLIQNIVPLLLRPVFGSMADKYGKKRIFMLSLSIRSIVGLLYAIASLPMLFVISLIRGMADSAKGPSASAMIADNTDEKNIARAYSLYTTTKSTSGGIGEAIAAFLVPTLVIVFIGTSMVTANVAVLDAVTPEGKAVEEFLKSPDEVGTDQTLPPDPVHTKPRKVVRVEQREMPLRKVPIDDLPKVVEGSLLKKALVTIFALSTILSALSLLLVQVFVKEKKKAKKEKPLKAEKLTRSMKAPEAEPNVWSFALLGAALTAPGYMVTGEFFILLAVKLQVTSDTLGWIKVVSETIVPLVFGPSFGWLADRIGAGKVIALRSVANLATSVLFWITPWFIGSALLGFMMGLARAVDEIGKAAFKPTWGAIAAKVSSYNLAKRGRTMGIMEGGVDASDLTFPVLAGLLLQYVSLTVLMAVRAVLAIVAEIYGYFLMKKHKI